MLRRFNFGFGFPTTRCFVASPVSALLSSSLLPFRFTSPRLLRSLEISSSPPCLPLRLKPVGAVAFLFHTVSWGQGAIPPRGFLLRPAIPRGTTDSDLSAIWTWWEGNVGSLIPSPSVTGGVFIGCPLDSRDEWWRSGRDESAIGFIWSVTEGMKFLAFLARFVVLFPFSRFLILLF